MRSHRNTSFLAATCLTLGASSADLPTATPTPSAVAELAFNHDDPSSLHARNRRFSYAAGITNNGQVVGYGR